MMRGPWLTTRMLVTAAAAGVASAVLLRVIGRTVHLVVPVPLSGKMVAAIPRTLLLLVVLARVRRPGILTLAGVVEAGMALVLGGMFPLSILIPVVGGLVADGCWLLSRPLRGERLRLGLVGFTLAGTQAVTVVAFLWAVGVPAAKVLGATVLGSIVAANAVLGLVAGLLAGSVAGELREAGVIE